MQCKDVIEDHWLITARKIPSPNYNERPPGVDIDLLVIHNISLPAGEFGTGCVEQLFTNCLDCLSHPSFEELDGLKVSSHLYIDRVGEVVQFVPFNLRAWHAGQSEYQGRCNCNDFSVGIEMEGTDNCPYTDQQYQSLSNVTRSLMMAYPAITTDRIVGHCEIAPDRKTDPGAAFDWERYKGHL